MSQAMPRIAVASTASVGSFIRGAVKGAVYLGAFALALFLLFATPVGYYVGLLFFAWLFFSIIGVIIDGCKCKCKCKCECRCKS